MRFGISYSGSARVHEVSVSGAGDIEAKDLQTEESTISISGAGDVTVHAEKILTIKISGVGDVYYVGDPVIYKKVSGWGSVKKL